MCLLQFPGGRTFLKQQSTMSSWKNVNLQLTRQNCLKDFVMTNVKINHWNMLIYKYLLHINVNCLNKFETQIFFFAFFCFTFTVVLLSKPWMMCCKSRSKEKRQGAMVVVVLGGGESCMGGLHFFFKHCVFNVFGKNAFLKPRVHIEICFCLSVLLHYWDFPFLAPTARDQSLRNT